MATPTQEDAKLLLQLYDLRRETRLRRARDFVGKQCKFKDYEDFKKRYPERSQGAAHVAMALGYWDLACILAAKGLVNAELFNESNFEHVSMWFRLKPVIEGWRKEWNFPTMMVSMETMAERHPSAAMFKQYMQAQAPAQPTGGSRRGGKKGKT